MTVLSGKHHSYCVCGATDTEMTVNQAGPVFMFEYNGGICVMNDCCGVRNKIVAPTEQCIHTRVWCLECVC
jgi:hypothetical protein